MVQREEERRQQLEHEQKHILETKTAFITAMANVVNTRSGRPDPRCTNNSS